jgi:trehalose 6-phosphate synthase/phosphatase
LVGKNQNVFIVSNRLPVTIPSEQEGTIQVYPSSGGLVAGLREVHKNFDGKWIGFGGIFSNEPGYGEFKNKLHDLNLLEVDIKRKTYNSYYNGFANDTLWPLFHYFPTAMKIDFDAWDAYREVNALFAEKVLQIAKDGDFVWIHDYHLMLLPALLRQANPHLHIAYFHHIPFPSSELFRILPFRKEILDGLMGADLIGFHIYDYVRHFLSSVSRLLGLDSHVDEIYLGDRCVKVGAYPLGVDVGFVEKVQGEVSSNENFQKFSKDLGGKILFLGLDRLDYSKGIPERLEAFRIFLSEHPEYVGKVTFLQVCVPSRTEVQTYGNLRQIIERSVSRINGEFGHPGYTAVQYIYQSFPMDDVIALYKLADVALVTPLRDGLNLVSKEYVAARDDENGVLILSEFAGSAAEMGEALLVNPKDTRNMAKAMFQAITMPREERRTRMQRLRHRILEYDNVMWAKSFMDAWYPLTKTNPVSSHQLVGQERIKLVKRLKESQRKFLFLDYDGTLTPIVSRPELAVPSDETLEDLIRLSELPGMTVTIVTGRPKEFCEQYFTKLPINIIAEHGAHFWLTEEKVWECQAVTEEFYELKPEILKLLELYTRCLPGSHIEEKDLSLVWHYRLAEQTFGRTLAMELSEAMVQLLQKTSYSVFHGKKNLDIRPVSANKGRAVEHFLNRKNWSSSEPFVTIGDDKTDEDMYKIYSEFNCSIHVGRSSSIASYSLKSSVDVNLLLKEMISGLA